MILLSPGDQRRSTEQAFEGKVKTEVKAVLSVFITSIPELSFKNCGVFMERNLVLEVFQTPKNMLVQTGHMPWKSNISGFDSPQLPAVLW